MENGGVCLGTLPLFFLRTQQAKGDLILEDKEINDILEAFGAHLKREKIFVHNPKRIMEIGRALEIAKELFPDHKPEINDDPLQTGALILSIECTDVDESMVFNDEREIDLFNEMVSAANNFEFYKRNGNIRFAAVFHGALKLIN